MPDRTPSTRATLHRDRRRSDLARPVAPHARKIPLPWRRPDLPQTRRSCRLRPRRSRRTGRGARPANLLRTRAMQMPAPSAKWESPIGLRTAQGSRADAKILAIGLCRASATRSVSGAARRSRAARFPRFDVLAVLLARQVTPRPTHRLSHGRRGDPGRGDARAWHGDHLGCRRPDLGRLAYRRSARPGDRHLSPDGGDAL